MKRITIFTYGVACYIVFLGVFLYAAGFLGNFIVPKSIDSGPTSPLAVAIAVDSALLGIFAMQHSIMARHWFKKAWTRLVPEPAERSTYVLFSSAALILLFWAWQPIGGIVWQVQSTGARIAMQVICATGWLIVLASTFLINHFDLFGLRQVWLHLRRQPYTPLRFRTPVLYRHVRHPLYFGWLLAFWATPVMSAAHLLFAGLATAYILVAIRFEERDLMRIHGEDYRAYRERVPMILPLGAKAKEPVATENAAA